MFLNWVVGFLLFTVRLMHFRPSISWYNYQSTTPKVNEKLVSSVGIGRYSYTLNIISFQPFYFLLITSCFSHCLSPRNFIGLQMNGPDPNWINRDLFIMFARTRSCTTSPTSDLSEVMVSAVQVIWFHLYYSSKCISFIHYCVQDMPV